MPAKRKRASDESDAPAAPPAKTTRSSARLAGNKAEEVEEVKKAPAKSKAAKAAKPVKAPKSAAKEKEKKSSKAASKEGEKPAKKSRAALAAKPAEKKKKEVELSDEEPEVVELLDDDEEEEEPEPVHTPFNPTRVLTLFKTYADTDDQSVIGAAGLEKLCTAARMPMDGVQPVLLAWQLGAAQMGQFSKDEWVKGLTALQCDTPYKISVAMSDLESILYNTKQPGRKPALDVYHKAKFWPYLEKRTGTLKKFHEFIFTFAKGAQRNLDIETALALLSVSLVQRFPLAGELSAYIKEKGAHKSLTKDLWNMIFDFCDLVHEDLSGYNEEDAWPTVMDEFVSWKRQENV